MRFDYFVRVTPPDSVLADVIDDFISLSYTRRLNEVGFLTLVVKKDDPLLDTIEIDSVIEVRRGQIHDTVGVNFYTDYAGLYRGHISESRSNGRQTITLYAPDGFSLIARAIVAYKAGDNTKSSWTATQTGQIILDLFVKNLINDSGRLLPNSQIGAFDRVGYTPWTIGGTTIDYTAAYKNLLTAMQEVAAIDNDYFFITISVGTFLSFNINVNAGDDRTATMSFDLERANMISAELDERRIHEPTKVLVAGQGEGSVRTTVVRTSGIYDSVNHTEVFVDARDATTTAQLNARGDTKIAETAYKPRFRFRASQTPASIYGRDYFLGDLITARYEGVSFNQRIVGVTVAVDEAATETIELELADES